MKLGLIGYPIAHSLSPWIHNQLLDRHEMTGAYQLYECETDRFANKVEEIKAENINGFNVTVPYKEQVLPYLDELDEAARFLGAVNTVKVVNGRLIGYNTDGIGYVASLVDRYADAVDRSKRVLILGSGGAARGIFHAIVKQGVGKIDLANRTIEKAQKLIDDFAAHSVSEALSLQEAEDNLAQYDLIIQTTSVGMAPNQEQTPISLSGITKDTIVSDIVYRPMKTDFLKEAEEKGARLHYGHGMLLHQAIYAFQIWTGKSTDASVMMEAFEHKLKGV
ncbi:shikimate dehydrogenase [Halobacillus shinanisalinarum]|uniref:Shikimate dehydrogenase (NADP(+)) n=1 Tax=Halobacillus shinanisalinarum TaxID=2932258 RepID=A0ABY4H038_9BACI|nr:shikimate dehydrogenase [Halobacillus shinanisalinarum]UOQ93806.1 shikimate dehydrogenase [Halobacillus shinanisalinarum]